MSIHCEAIKVADDDYMRKVAAWKACKAAGIDIPYKLSKFFEHEDPDDTGIILRLDKYEHFHQCCQEWSSDGASGYQVDVSKLPPGTKFVRFYLSY